MWDLKNESGKGMVNFPIRPMSFKVVEATTEIPYDLLYPTRHKDGNKLGKRKRSIKKQRVLFDEFARTFYVNKSDMENFTKQFKMKSYPSIEVVKINSQEPTFMPINPVLTIPDKDDRFDTLRYIGMLCPLKIPEPPICMISAT